VADRTFNVLFLCTGNSARSVLAEAYSNHKGRGRFRAYSAASHPTGKINQGAIDLLERLQISTEGLRSKAWDEFALPGAPPLDFVITVCDNAAGEVCPVWPGQPITAHWGVADPAHVEGAIERANAFREAFRVLSRRIDLFTNLPVDSLDRMALRKEVRDIGEVSQ
jgi:arsenate reductase (thioredoxin)